MRGMGIRKHTVEEIEKALLGDGQALGDYFIADGIVHFWPKRGRQAFCFFDGVEFGAACLEYLRSHGVPEYHSSEEAWAARAAPFFEQN